jgi:hypothetical protein
MTPTATIPDRLILTEPCELCGEVKTIYDVPPHDICTASPTGDYECDVYRQVRLIEEIAPQLATLIQRVHDEDVRRELAEGVAGGFSNALYTLARGVDFNEAAFLATCGCRGRL